jgi:hypothetical protein
MTKSPENSMTGRRDRLPETWPKPHSQQKKVFLPHLFKSFQAPRRWSTFSPDTMRVERPAGLSTHDARIRDETAQLSSFSDCFDGNK